MITGALAVVFFLTSTAIIAIDVDAYEPQPHWPEECQVDNLSDACLEMWEINKERENKE